MKRPYLSMVSAGACPAVQNARPHIRGYSLHFTHLSTFRGRKVREFIQFFPYAYFCHHNRDSLTSVNLSACFSDVSVLPLVSGGEVHLTKCKCLYLN